MNRGFKKYYKEGYNNAKEALRKKGNLCRYYLYVFVSLLSYLFIFVKPVIDMAGVRLLKMIRADKEIAVSKAISSSDNAKSYWTCLLAYIIKGLMILAIILVIGLIGFALAGFGYAIYSASAFSDELYYLPIIHMIPAIVILAIFIIALPILTVPISYIADTNPNMGASKVLFLSVDSLKKTGKGTLFLSYLIEGLIKLIFILIPLGFYAYLYNNLLSEPAEVMGIMIGVAILVTIVDAIVYVLFITKFIVGLKLSRILLFEDLVLDNFNGAKRLTGIEFKEEKSEYKSKLERLFDHTDSSHKDASLLSQLREINATRVNKDTSNIELTLEEMAVINAIPESDLSDMKAEKEELELQIEAASSVENEEIVEEIFEEAIEPEVDEIIEEAIEPKANEIIEENEIIEDAVEPDGVATELDHQEAIENDIVDEVIAEEIAIESQAEAIENEIEEVDQTEENTIEQELTEEELELLNAIPSTEYDDDMKKLMDELRAFEEMHKDLDEDEIKNLDEDSLFNNDVENAEIEFDPANISEDEIEKMLNEVKDDLYHEADEIQLSDDELDILNSIPDADISSEEIVYVDEDGNPIEIADDEIITEEEIVYVDEDGNPVEINENVELEETDSLEFESFINSLDEQQNVEDSTIKPKRGRKKKEKEGE